MAVLSSILFDTFAESHSLTNSDMTQPWFLTGSTPPVVSASAAAHGARGVTISGTTTAVKFEYREAATTAPRVISQYFRLVAAGGSAVFLGGALNDTTNQADWRINTDRTVAVRNAQVAVGTSSQVLALNTWYRSEWLLSPTGQELRIYQGESVTPYIVLSGALTDATTTTISGGLTASPTGWSVQFDTIQAADNWVGPYGTPQAPLPTPTGFSFTAAAGPAVALNASWSAVTGAESYELEVEQRVSGDTWSAFNSYTGTTTSRSITTGLTSGRTYRARVRALPAGF